ncbi:MAG: efflux RND transporter periplasmic adaptor subunit [Bacillota bacterium]
MVGGKIVRAALVLVLLMALGAVAACGKKDKAEPAVEARLVETVLMQVEKASRYSELSGTLQPEEEALLSFEAAGRIVEMAYREGDRISAGDLMASLDAAEYSVQVAQAKTGLDKALVNYQKAKDDFARMDQLYNQGALSKSDFENAQNRLTVAEKDYSYAQQAYSLVAGAGPGSGKDRLRAPIGGTVLAKLSSAGQTVGIGTPVYRIGRIDTLKVVLPVPDYEISLWKVGETVALTLYKDNREGKITRIFPTTSQGSGTIGVEVTIANPNRDWFPGQVVRAVRAVETREGLFLPAEAVMSRGEGKPYVFIANGETAVKTHVTTGDLIGTRLEITSGLKAGDRVVVRGADLLSDGGVIKQAGEAKK